MSLIKTNNRTLDGNQGRRNLIINGAMQVAQRDTSFSTGTSGAYTLDRWQVLPGSSANFDATITQDTTVPDTEGFTNSLKIAVDSVISYTSGQNNCFVQKLEKYSVQHLRYGTSNAKSVTLSFWVRSNVTGTYNLQIQTNQSSSTEADKYSYVTDWNVSTADTWEKKTITIPGNTAQSFNQGVRDEAFRVVFHFGGDSDDNVSTLDQWFQSGAYKNTANLDNLFSDASNELYLTGLQLEVGSVPSDFEHLLYGEELSLCQRYYFETNKITGQVANASNAIFQGLFRTEMRTRPTVSGGPYTIWQMTVAGSKTQSSANNNADTNQNNRQSFNIQCGNFSGLSQYYPVGIASGGPIKFDSEL